MAISPNLWRLVDAKEPEKPNDALGYLKNNSAGHQSLVTELRATATENGQLRQKVETLEKEKFLLEEQHSATEATLKKEKFLLMEQLSATEAKLKAALEKTEEKVKDKEEPKHVGDKEEPAKVAVEAAKDDDDDEAGKKVRGELIHKPFYLRQRQAGL